MKIIVGCPIKDRAAHVPDWYGAIESQGIDVEVACVLSPSSDETEQLLRDRGVTIIHDYRPGRPTSAIRGHQWGVLGTYAYMAELRNQLVHYAVEREADYLFSLDSDIMLPAGALSELLEWAPWGGGVVAPAVNMVRHGTAWNTMSWLHPTAPLTAARTPNPTGGLADVVMAAMLLDKSAFGCQWQAHPQGEDLGFCLDAVRLGVDRTWVPTIVCEHRL